MMQEYAIVRLKNAVAEIPIDPGTEGTIVMVHPVDPPAYEVEFFDDKVESIGVYTMRDSDLEVIPD